MDGTILVADDDRTIRTVLTQALTRAGCKVHATSSLMTLMRWVDLVKELRQREQQHELARIDREIELTKAMSGR